MHGYMHGYLTGDWYVLNNLKYCFYNLKYCFKLNKCKEFFTLV